jgi:hypothetical protein
MLLVLADLKSKRLFSSKYHQTYAFINIAVKIPYAHLAGELRSKGIFDICNDNVACIEKSRSPEDETDS